MMSPAADRALVAWPMLTAEVTMFGTAVFALLLAPAQEFDALADALTPLWRALSLLALFCAPLALLISVANMGDVSLRAAIAYLPEVIRETHFGHIWRLSLPLTVIPPLLAWAPGSARVRSAGIALATGALLLLVSLASHAIDRGGAAVAIYFVHEIAASLWIGAILTLWMGAIVGRLGARWITRTAPRVSSAAGWTVAVLILSGIYTAYYSLDADPRRLIYAAYGRVLVDKLCAAMLVLLIGGYNRYWLMPRVNESAAQESLLRNVGIESLLLIGVLGLAALLANTPPAH